MSPPITSPRVSVIVPCHNLGQYLDEAVASVTAQTFHDFELIIIDDGSDEPGTLRALEEIERRGGRVIHTENRGLSAARNRGVAETTGEFICSLDADDRLRPEWLERAVAVLDSDPSLSFVSHWLHTFGTSDSTWQPERLDLETMVERNVVNGAALFRRTLTEAIGGFDESMRQGCEDWEFWIRALESGHSGTILPEVMYDYRLRAGSMTEAMHRGDTHARIYTVMIEKHRPTFEARLVDLWLHRERAIATMQKSIDATRQQIELVLRPALKERRRELEIGSARLRDEQHRVEVETQARHERMQLTEALKSSHATAETMAARVKDLEASASWRLTAPLRRVYDLLRGVRQR